MTKASKRAVLRLLLKVLVLSSVMTNPANAQRTGVLNADGFDYPIDNRGYDPPYKILDGIKVGAGKTYLAEGFLDERNVAYPDNPSAFWNASSQSPVTRSRGRPGNGSAYVAQDVGSYLPVYNGKTYGGLHPAEDWHAPKDVGAEVCAVANGEVVKLGTVNNDQTTGNGWYVVIRHWLPVSGTTYDSVYLHICPKRKTAGSENTDGSIGAYGDFEFRPEVNWAVKKGAIIARIGATPVPHLHFEMRSKPVGVKLYPNDNGKGYYSDVKDHPRVSGWTQNRVETAVQLMKDDGIIDPSDFIDDHRTLFSAGDLLALKATHPNRIEVRNCIALGIMNNKDTNGVVDDRVWMNLERTLTRGEVVTILKAAANAYKVNLVEGLPTVNPGTWFAGDTELSESSHYPTVQLFAQKGLLDITQPKFRVNDPASFGEAVHFLWKVFGLGESGPTGSEALFTYRRDKLKTALFLRPLELDYDLSSPTSRYYHRVGGVLTRKITARRDWLYEKGIGELKDIAYSNPIRRSVIAKLIINTILWRITNPSPAVP